MFDLDHVPDNLRPTEACSNTPTAAIDDRCSELISAFRPVSAQIGDPQFTTRYAKAVASLAPFLGQNLDLGQLRVLEVGSGHGAKALALAPFVKEYVGLELVPKLVDFARDAQQKLNVPNVRFDLDEAANIDNYLANQDAKFDLILLYAVLEHLTIEEKLGLLTSCWQHLGDDGHIFIGETPNRMLPLDLHSSQLLYFQQAPSEIQRLTFNDAGNQKWAHNMQFYSESGDFDFGMRRRGLHVGHQELDLGLMPVEELQNHVVDDSFSAHIMNLYFYMPIEFLKLVEFGFLHEYEDMKHVTSRRFPPFMSRYFMEVLLSKRPQPQRGPTSIAASIGTGSSVVSGSAMSPTIIAPQSSAWWPVPDPEHQRRALIGFQRPAAIGAVQIRADGQLVDEFAVRNKLALLRSWRQELVYETTIPAGTKEFSIGNAGRSQDYSIRFVGFR